MHFRNIIVISPRVAHTSHPHHEWWEWKVLNFRRERERLRLRESSARPGKQTSLFTESEIFNLFDEAEYHLSQVI